MGYLCSLHEVGVFHSHLACYLILCILRPLACGDEVSLHAASSAAGCVNLYLKNLLHCGFLYCREGVSKDFSPFVRNMSCVRVW